MRNLVLHLGAPSFSTCTEALSQPVPHQSKGDTWVARDEISHCVRNDKSLPWVAGHWVFDTSTRIRWLELLDIFIRDEGTFRAAILQPYIIRPTLTSRHIRRYVVFSCLTRANVGHAKPPATMTWVFTVRPLNVFVALPHLPNEGRRRPFIRCPL